MTKDEIKLEVIKPQFYVGYWLGRDIYYNPSLNTGVLYYSNTDNIYDYGPYEFIKNWIEYGAVSMNKNPFGIIHNLEKINNLPVS